MRKFCQSCGMPMKDDPEAGGSHADGSKSADYCSYCYAQGEFTQPDFTAQQMQDFCIDKLHDMGYPRFFGWLFTRSIPQLERWKNAKKC